MKKTKFLLSFVFICVMLSFFSFALAGNILVSTGSENRLNKDKSSHSDDMDILSINGDATSSDVYFTYTGSEPGIFKVSCEYVNGNEKSYIYYHIQVEENNVWKDVSLAAVKDGDDYKVLSPTTSSGGTDAYVMLEKNKNYRIFSLSTPNVFGYTYNANFYKDPDLNISGTEYYQTNISSQARTAKSYNANTPVETGSRPAEISTGRLVSYAGDMISNLPPASENPFEKAVVDLLLKIGDFFVRLISDIVGENVTIASLIFNRVPDINPNFWSEESNSNILGVKVKEIINEWFMFFRGIAIIFYIIAVLTIGIHVIYNSTGSGIQKAKELFSQWIKGVLILFLMPIAMKYIFEVNEALVKLLAEEAGTNIQYGARFSDGSTWSSEAIEFRSPEYVSKYTGTVSYGSEEANKSYIKKVGDYEKNFDIMRIMRAYAGVTFKLGYVFLWYVCIGQLVVFIVLYYRRFFMITFLIAIFPITCIFHATSIWQGGRGTQMNVWLKEYTSNVFLQFIHAIIYSVITGACIGIIKDSIQSSGGSAVANWLVILIAINFVPEGEKIMKKIFSALSSGSTSGGASESSSRIRQAYENGKRHVKSMFGR